MILSKKNNSGFTLIELIMAMAITTIVSAGIFGAYIRQQKTHNAQKQSIEMQQNLRIATLIMTKELRMAGFDPKSKYNARIVNAGDGSDSSNKLKFTYYNQDAKNDGLDNNNDGNIDESGEDLQAVEYYLYDSLSDGSIDLGRRYGARLDAIAENIQSLQFVYFDIDGNITNVLSDIRAIQITIVATTDPNELNYTKTNNTRTLITTVKCRNMGL